MVNFPFNSPIYFLQIRSLATKTSKLVESTVKPSLTSKAQINLDLISSDKEDSAITLLKKYNFNDAQIAKLAQRTPKILRCKVESILEPKLRFLIENGFTGSVLTELVVKNPQIFLRSLSGHLVPNIDYLRELMRNDETAVLFVVKRATWLLTSDLKKILQPNIELLLEEGVAMSTVLKGFTSYPRTFICSFDRMRYGLETVQKFGIKPTDNMFIYALRVVLSLSESNLNKKFEVLKSLGWSDEDIISTMARQPLCFSQSEDKLRSAFEFFVKSMHLKPEEVISYPKLVMYSLSKRSIPRCKVIMALKAKKLLKDLHLPQLINMSEETFTRKFILNHPALSSHLWVLYRGNQEVDGVSVEQ